MDLSALRGRVLAANLAAHGVPATVTRPSPDDTPVTLVGIWITPIADEQLPAGRDYPRTEPRRIFAIPKTSLLSGCPRNSLIVAAETGAASRTWRVEGYEQAASDHWRVMLVPAV